MEKKLQEQDKLNQVQIMKDKFDMAKRHHID